jgi:hypothetical protein
VTATAPPEFIYDAIRKIGIGRGVAVDGRTWTIEFHTRHADDSMDVIIRDPDGGARSLTLLEDDFAFGGDGTVSLRASPAVTLRMDPIYMKKLCGFTRGNIPTPDIAGPSLP